MGMATVKLVADMNPALKAQLQRYAKRNGITLRAAVERAISELVVQRPVTGDTTK